MSYVKEDGTGIGVKNTVQLKIEFHSGCIYGIMNEMVKNGKSMMRAKFNPYMYILK